MSLFHIHDWQFLAKGIGVYRKGNQPLEFSVDGTAERCHCKRVRFVPQNERLGVVPCETDLLPSDWNNYRLLFRGILKRVRAAIEYLEFKKAYVLLWWAFKTCK